MNYLPQQPKSERAHGSHPAVVSMLTTAETTITVTSEATLPSSANVEAEIKRRAEAMTAVLAKIMDRPDSVRHWGLNE